MSGIAGSLARLMRGATSLLNGRSGYVTRPLAGDHAKFLRGDGSWISLPAGDGLGDMLAANLLGEFDNATKRKTARENLGVQAMTRLSKSVAGGVDVTLTAAEADNQIIDLTGAITANINVQLPQTLGKMWIIRNSTSGNFTLTVWHGSGAGLKIRRGCAEIANWNGTRTMCVTTDAFEKSGVRARELRAGLLFDGSTVGARCVFPMAGPQTSDFTVICDARIPDMNPAANAALWHIASNPSSVTSYDATFYLDASTPGRLIYRQYGVTTGDFRQSAWDISTTYLGKIVQMGFVRTGASVALYINGELVTGAAVTTQGTTPPAFSDTITANNFVVGARSIWLWNSRLYTCSVINRALSVTEIAQQDETGFSVLARGGSMTPHISPVLANGGFETAGAGGADVFANWSEGTAGTSTVNRDTVEFHSGAASCRFDVDVAGSLARVTASNSMVVGRLHRVELWAKASVNGAKLRIDNSDDLVAVQPFEVTTEWVKYTFEFTATGTSLTIKREPGGVTNGASLWVDSVSLFRVGTILEPDFTVCAGLQIPDRSGNESHGLLTPGPAHILPDRRGQVRGSTNTSGNQQLCGGSCLLTSARITSIMAYVASGTPTISIGSGSGGAQIAASQTLATGMNTITLAGQFSSTGNVWINSNSTDVIKWTIPWDLGDT